MEFLLEETAQAFKQLDEEKKLPSNIEIGIHNENFLPCLVCKKIQNLCDACASLVADDLKNNTNGNPSPKENICEQCIKKQNVYSPTTHCMECIPVVTHTKQGICVLVKRKDKILIMDLIPVLPSPPVDNVMNFYRMVITSLHWERPCGWKKAFNAYFTKDKVIPPEMHDLAHGWKKVRYAKTKKAGRRVVVKRKEKNVRVKQATKSVVMQRKKTFGITGERNYILVKLLHYGQGPNSHIRPTQSVDAISKLTSEHSDCRAFQYAKVLKKLLGIEDIGSYLMKKAFLTTTNYNRVDSYVVSSDQEHQARLGLRSILHNSETFSFFNRKLDYKHKQFQSKLTKEGILLLLPNQNKNTTDPGNRHCRQCKTCGKCRGASVCS